jgi:signal transduction histidine kinase/ligand-binding sensor domain-containing protein
MMRLVRKALIKILSECTLPAVSLVLLLSTGPVFGSSGDWFARAWQSDEGLPDNNVSGIAQTADGFLWVGTVGGLVRFDGSRFDEFSVLNIKGVPSPGVRTLLLDHRGRLWLSMDRGVVVCADATSAKVLTTKEGIPNSQTQVIAEDGEGKIWMSYGTRRNLAFIKDGQVTVLGEADGIPARGECYIAADTKGELWLAKSGHLTVYRKGKFKPMADYAQTGNVRIAAARGGGMWISSGANVWRYDEEEGLQLMTELPEGISASVMLEDHTGALWIGTDAGGLFRLDKTKLESMPTSHGQIECLAEGREGNIWVGTYGGGLNRLRLRALELIGTDQGLPFESVRSVTQDSVGRVWAVTQNGLLARNEGTNWVVVSHETNWPGGEVTCVASDADGVVWIGTKGHGLVRFKDGQYKSWRMRGGLASDTIHGLLVTRAGDVWINFTSRIQRFSAGEFENIDLPEGTRYLRAFTEDTVGNVWAGTTEGRLFFIKDGQVTDKTEQVQGEAISIRCLYTSSDGALWIGYAGGGLGRYKAGKYVRITTKEGLHDNYISQIVEDKLDRVWLAGNAGIQEISKKELSRVADDLLAGRKTRLRSALYGRSEGLPSLQANFDTTPGAVRTLDGRVWMAMRTGLAVVHTENIQDNPDVPPVIVERVLVDGEPVAVYDGGSPLRGGELHGLLDLRDSRTVPQLSTGYRKLEFDFTALSFIAPENVNFRYRLEGLEDQWTEAGPDRKANYAHLGSGDYQFHVIACNNSGVWNDTGATIHFSVQPFLWQRWPFEAAMLGVFTLCVVAIVRYVSFRRLRTQVQHLEEQAVVHKERARIAKDIHDDLGANLTQITLLSELTRQDMGEPEKAGGHVEKISSTARQVMKSLDEIVWAVNPRNDTLPHLVDYLGQFTIDFLRAPGIRCRLDLPEHPPALSVPADIRHNLFLAVKEALNNIVKHAAAKEVRLGVDVSNGKLRVVVTDDGHGFDRPPQDAWADGLRNMRQRMAEIGGDCLIESRTGAGTTIRFDVPWRN